MLSSAAAVVCVQVLDKATWRTCRAGLHDITGHIKKLAWPYEEQLKADYDTWLAESGVEDYLPWDRVA